LFAHLSVRANMGSSHCIRIYAFSYNFWVVFKNQDRLKNVRVLSQQHWNVRLICSRYRVTSAGLYFWRISKRGAGSIKIKIQPRLACHYFSVLGFERVFDLLSLGVRSLCQHVDDGLFVGAEPFHGFSQHGRVRVGVEVGCRADSGNALQEPWNKRYGAIRVPCFFLPLSRVRK